MLKVKRLWGDRKLNVKGKGLGALYLGKRLPSPLPLNQKCPQAAMGKNTSYKLRSSVHDLNRKRSTPVVQDQQSKVKEHVL